MSTKEEAINKVKAIIEKFERLNSEGKLKSINEENTKNWFIEPLFEALGWDIHSEEVSKEEKVSKGRADYAFRIDGVIKFFLEAKGVKEDLNDPKFAKQTIEYGWYKGVTWAILTDFEGIKVFNCEWNEKNIWRNVLFDVTYKQFIHEFNKLWLLSRESFKTDELGKYAEQIGKRIPRRRISDYLLSEFIDWRTKLVNNLKKDYPTYSEQERDEMVQTFLNRLIFIRNCEDRGQEEKLLDGALRDFIFNRKNFNSSIKIIFRYYDEHYDSKIFELREIDKIDFQDRLLENIIGRLYKTEDGNIAYDFSLIDADILGNLYEQYLSHISKKSEEKNQAKRKSQGIYYTPTFIVDYIVKNTFGEILRDKKTDSDKIKILDPACGSGSFLIKAFDFLNDLHKKRGDYEQNKLDNDGTPYSTKEKILRNNLFGVDLDKQAVEIAQLNLLLKIAEKSHKLPILRKSIQNGNSLIDDESFERYFNWSGSFNEIIKLDTKKEITAGYGFDIIIGNPPYGVEFNQKERAYFRKNYLSASRVIDSYILFIERATKLLKEGGVMGFIIPESWLANPSNANLREYLLKNFSILQIVDLPGMVFPQATVDTIILILRNSKPSNNKIKINFVDKFPPVVISKEVKILQSKFLEIKDYIINTHFTEEIIDLIEKIDKDSIKLNAICKNTRGIETGDNDKYLSSSKEGEEYLPLITGDDIERYCPPSTKYFVKYGNWLSNSKSLDIFKGDKIILQRIKNQNLKRRLVATIDNKNRIILDSVHMIYNIEKDYSPYYILALFNSTLLNFYFKLFSLYPRINADDLDNLPIKKITSLQQQSFVKLAEEMLFLCNQLKEFGDKKTERRQDIEERLTKIDQEIDDRVYEIYGIHKKEREIIESY